MTFCEYTPDTPNEFHKGDETGIDIVWNDVRNAARAPLITVEICELEH